MTAAERLAENLRWVASVLDVAAEEAAEFAEQEKPWAEVVTDRVEEAAESLREAAKEIAREGVLATVTVWATDEEEDTHE